MFGLVALPNIYIVVGKAFLPGDEVVPMNDHITDEGNEYEDKFVTTVQIQVAAVLSVEKHIFRSRLTVTKAFALRAIIFDRLCESGLTLICGGFLILEEGVFCKSFTDSYFSGFFKNYNST